MATVPTNMHQTTSLRPIAELGFTRSFISHLQNSKEQLSRYVEEQKLQAVAIQVSLDRVQSNQQDIVHEMMERLKRIQLQRGIVATKETTDCATGLDVNNNNNNTAAHLKDKQVQMEHDLAQAHASLTQTQAHLEESQRKLVLERNKAEQVKKMRLRSLEAKKTTVNDLTYAIVKYRMLGLDFVKGDTGPTSLQCNFTQIDPADPSRVFSFGFNVSPEEDEYQVDACIPPLPSHVILQLVDELNTSSNQVDALPVFIRGMRRAFKQYAL